MTNLIILDSVSHLTPECKGAIVVCGSHGGASAARHALAFEPAAIFFSDAGKGKDNAGIAGLALFDAHNIPAAAIDIWSARIGDGKDSYECGSISAVNLAAQRYGLADGITVKTAVEILKALFGLQA
ncbi:MAG: hypothetical protein OEV28_02815 [Nitrospirota bacterium]|nr:hypothetical protein [Nitrospirota bacterium]